METTQYRAALGRFPTAVSVIVARGRDGVLAGLTANSVIPVCDDPPRLAWSLQSGSRSRDVFEQTDYFAVNILAHGQDDIARRLAARAADRFAGLAYREAGRARLPMFDGCVAWYGCRRGETVEIGDHLMVFGDIVEIDERTASPDILPLLYYAGRFARLDCNPENLS